MLNPETGQAPFGTPHLWTEVHPSVVARLDALRDGHHCLACIDSVRWCVRSPGSDLKHARSECDSRVGPTWWGRCGATTLALVPFGYVDINA